jgi:hypothetical protein
LKHRHAEFRLERDEHEAAWQKMFEKESEQQPASMKCENGQESWAPGAF